MRMERFFQLALIASILSLSWLGMMIVHEVGHVVMAWASGEKVSVAIHRYSNGEIVAGALA